MSRKKKNQTNKNQTQTEEVNKPEKEETFYDRILRAVEEYIGRKFPYKSTVNGWKLSEPLTTNRTTEGDVSNCAYFIVKDIDETFNIYGENNKGCYVTKKLPTHRWNKPYHIVLIDQFLFDKNIEELEDMDNLSLIHHLYILCTDGTNYYYLSCDDMKKGRYYLWHTFDSEYHKINDGIINLYDMKNNDDEEFRKKYLEALNTEAWSDDCEAQEHRHWLIGSGITTIIVTLITLGIFLLINKAVDGNFEFANAEEVNDIFLDMKSGDWTQLLLIFPIIPLAISVIMILFYSEFENNTVDRVNKILQYSGEVPQLDEFRYLSADTERKQIEKHSNFNFNQKDNPKFKKKVVWFG